MDLVVTLLVVGAVLIILETVLPGAIAGIVGLGCVAAGVVLAYVRFGPQRGHWILFGTVVALTAGFAIWLKVFPNTPFGRRLISNREVGNINAEQPELLHKSGTALTQLRPSGMALIDGRRVDVVTEGALIERGTPLKVVAIEGMRVIVRASA